jgi:aromatic ring-opening dioxygenase catalytic subunit (LigB family)
MTIRTREALKLQSLWLVCYEFLVSSTDIPIILSLMNRLIAFDPKKNPLNVPIVQVSLFNSEDVDQHYRMGQALESLRDEGILIIGAGMAVHNLHDFRATRGRGDPMP